MQETKGNPGRQEIMGTTHLTCASSTKGAPQRNPDLGVDVGFFRVPDVLWKNDKVLQRYFVLVPSYSYDETLLPKQLEGRKGLLCHSLTLREVSAGIRQEPPVC